jgi:hypothetical protein
MIKFSQCFTQINVVNKFHKPYLQEGTCINHERISKATTIPTYYLTLEAKETPIPEIANIDTPCLNTTASNYNFFAHSI